MPPDPRPDRWLQGRLDAQAGAWLGQAIAAIPAGGVRAAAIAIAQVPRRIPDRPLDPLPEAGWTPSGWSLRDAARVRLACALAEADPAWPAGLEALCREADLGELVALHRGLPCYPRPGALRGRAAAGLRSSIAALFEAVALDSPYPAAWLDGPAWNQLVLKAFFTGSDTRRILGWRDRANPALSAMLRDYARERRAARRPVDPGLWEVAAAAADPQTAAELHALAQASP